MAENIPDSISAHSDPVPISKIFEKLVDTDFIPSGDAPIAGSPESLVLLRAELERYKVEFVTSYDAAAEGVPQDQARVNVLIDRIDTIEAILHREE